MSSCNNNGKFPACRMLLAPMYKFINRCFLLCHYEKQAITSITPKIFLALLFFFILSEQKLFAQDKISDGVIAYYSADNLNTKEDDKKDDKKNPSFTYDEIPVLLIIDGYGNYDLDVIYSKNNLLYVNIEDLFRILMIPCAVGQKGDSLAGFIENESNPYFIDYNTKQITVGKNTISCKSEMVKEIGMLYLESSLLAEAFGISLVFNYRALSVILKSNFELPLIKQQRLEKMRKSMTQIKGGEVIADTVFNRNYHLFKFGTIDWRLSSYQTWNSAANNQLNLGVGTELLYGEANVSGNYNSQYDFNTNQLQYLWRWVDNDKKIIRQAQVGKIATQSTAYLNSPLIGAVIRNTPTTVRKAKGHYTISDYTEPNWTVELYINDVMVDYTKADASGMYFFEVPNVYGFTTLKLKFYGPMGEERIEERTVNIPYTFMPEKEFEYSLTSGILQDTSLSRYTKGEANYGVTRMLTVGGGIEYLSSISESPYIPFAKTSIQPFSKLTLIGEYAHGVRTRGLLNYYFFKNASLIIDYSKYVKDQQATLFRYLEVRKIILSLPFRIKKISGFSKLDFSQNVYETFIYNQTNLILSAFYKQFSINSTTQLNWTKNNQAYILSTNSLSLRLKKGLVLRPSILYNITQNTVTTYNLDIEKRMPNGYISVGYQRNIYSNDNIISIGFKYDLSFAKTNTSVTYRNGHISSSESASGSVTIGSGNKQVFTNKNSSLGKGGISIYPFLDLNNNSIFDPGEKMVRLSSVKVFGGKVVLSEKDSIVRIPNLNAFISYNIEFSDNDLDNIAWRFKKKIYSVLIDPNQFKRIDVPITVVGEASGMVYMNNNNSLRGIGRILINFYKRNSNEFVTKTLSELDGYIDYLGFAPGEYVARVDSLQLSKLDFIAEPPQINFTIKASEEGDIIDGIDFILTRKKLIKETDQEKIINNN